jgi:anti-sigma regulatory factor (Ser/Thr protein kinase)
MTISVQMTSDLMIVEIVDNARPQHAEIWQQKAKSKSRLEGGMGLELVEQLCHAVRYTSDDHGNQVYLSFDIKQK